MAAYSFRNHVFKEHVQIRKLEILGRNKKAKISSSLSNRRIVNIIVIEYQYLLRHIAADEFLGTMHGYICIVMNKI